MTYDFHIKLHFRLLLLSGQRMRVENQYKPG